ncbi:alcohol dehydrogenase catalytic domain-containing protein [Streptomyces sp. YIM S03343]
MRGDGDPLRLACDTQLCKVPGWIPPSRPRGTPHRRGASWAPRPQLPRRSRSPQSEAVVVVEVAYCGICGSDFPRYFDGAVHQVPQTLGHEFSGVVVEVGEGVDQVAPGRHVAVAPLVPCHDCTACAAGRPALCRSYSFIGSRPGRRRRARRIRVVPARHHRDGPR